MSGLAIQAENLSKQYFIARASNAHPTLHEFLTQLLRSPAERIYNVLRGLGAKDRQQTFWALKDVSFEVPTGTVVGVIGRNGSGKSTLLKILSRITDPTTGRASLNGRVGSLLEVGTGFHPELSGRENIFLNGAMLGMRRHEIRRRFDDIVEFSEVSQFLDTPVKHYSSGMYMRLAFAVAAHLEPEILIVDEVLAVGDPAFQKKCLAKLESVSREGRTVLVVSHALPIIQGKCQSCIWLDKGKLMQAGKTSEVIAAYVKSLDILRATPLKDRTDRDGDGRIRYLSVEFQDEHGQEITSLLSGEPITIELRIMNTTGQDLREAEFSFFVEDSANTRLTFFSTRVIDWHPAIVGPGEHAVKFRVPRWPLSAGRYAYSLICRVQGQFADVVHSAGSFHVESGNFYGSGRFIPPSFGQFYTEFRFAMDPRAMGARAA